MPFTDAQKHAVRFYAGFSEGFHPTYQRVEAALARMELPENAGGFARLTNDASGSPPGLLALLEQLHAEIYSARSRFKAEQVGSIKLNAGEFQLRKQHLKFFANEMCQVLGIPKVEGGPNAYANYDHPSSRGSGGGLPGRFVGK